MHSLSVSLCPFLFLTLAFSLSLSLSRSPSPSLSLSRSLSLSLSISLSLSLFPCPAVTRDVPPDHRHRATHAPLPHPCHPTRRSDALTSYLVQPLGNLECVMDAHSIQLDKRCENMIAKVALEVVEVPAVRRNIPRTRLPIAEEGSGWHHRQCLMQPADTDR